MAVCTNIPTLNPPGIKPTGGGNGGCGDVEWYGRVTRALLDMDGRLMRQGKRGNVLGAGGIGHTPV